jgi:hypothetical protein
MDFSEITNMIIVGILASLFGMSLLQFSSVKKSMRIQSEQQIYARIIETRMKLENTKRLQKWQKKTRYLQNG